MMRSSREIPGAQSSHRTLQLLRLLAAHDEHGLSIKELVQMSALERPTVHRLVACLEREGFVQRDASRRRYQLGMESMHLGIATQKRAPLVAVYRSAIQKMARVCGDAVFLTVRQGDYSSCLFRAEGSSQAQAFMTRTGDLRPMGVGAPGLSMLALMPQENVERIYRRHTAAFDTARMGYLDLCEAVARTRRNGFAELTDTITDGVTGIGRPLLMHGQPVAAISIVALNSRMSPDRRQELAALLGGLAPLQAVPAVATP